MNYSKLNVFAWQMKPSKKKKKKIQPPKWENIFSDTPDRGLISKIYKELIKLNNNNNQSN